MHYFWSLIFQVSVSFFLPMLKFIFQKSKLYERLHSDYKLLFYHWDKIMIHVSFYIILPLESLEIKYVAWYRSIDFECEPSRRLMVSHLHDTLWYDLIDSIDTKWKSVYMYNRHFWHTSFPFKKWDSSMDYAMESFILPDRFAFLESFYISIYYLHIMINCENIDLLITN